MKEKKILSSKLRSEIVVDNIFKILEKKHLKQKDLAEFCFVNESDVSKWKNYKAKINMDDIDKIADFLQVSIDDLFYTEEEKKRGVPELKGKVDPNSILAQRLVKVIIGAPTRKVHLLILIITSLIMFFEFFVIAYLNLDIYNLFLYIATIILFIIHYGQYSHEETFVVNYMSDVFYKIENTKNKFYVTELITRIISAICILPITIFFYYSLIDSYDKFILSIGILVFVEAIFITMNFLGKNKKYKEEVYHWEFDKYELKYYNLVSSSLLFVVFLYLTIFESFPYQFIILLSINLIAKVIDYILCSIKTSEYKIAMIDENKVISYLQK